MQRNNSARLHTFMFYRNIFELIYFVLSMRL